jgi:hypothetical protein
MEVMGYRYALLEKTLCGYDHTGVPLVGTDGTAYFSVPIIDDGGSYYFIPAIARAFGLSLPAAINVFYAGILLGSLLLGLIGLFLIFSRPASRALAVGTLAALAGVTWLSGDVYVVSACATLALLPLGVYFFVRARASAGLFLFAFTAGSLGWMAHWVRGHAATGAAVFLGCLLAGSRGLSWRAKLAAVLCFLAGTATPWACVHELIAERDAFLAGLPENARLESTEQHPFWHCVYIGFGFLDNPYGLKYQDDAAGAVVRRSAPEVPPFSARYEQIVRGELFRLIREHPFFCVRTLFAKMGVVGMYLLFFAHAGLVAAVIRRKPLCLDVAFVAAMLINASFGLLVVPHHQYMLGFMAAAGLFGIVSLGYVLEPASLVSMSRPQATPTLKLPEQRQIQAAA